MPKLLGIDIGTTSVRAILVRSSYRKLAVEGVGECEIASVATLSEALRLATQGLSAQGESVSVSLGGERIFVRPLRVPKTAQKQLAEVLPFELEASLPIELDEIVFDYALRRRSGSDEELDVLAVAARTEDVSDRIELARGVLTTEPEKVIGGSLPLAALAQVMPALGQEGPIGILEIGEQQSELLILEHGDAVFARTLGRGAEGFAEDSTPWLRELRQTLSSFRASGGKSLDRLYLAGPGASLPGIEGFLAAEVGIQAVPLPPAEVEPMSEELAAALPRFAKAFALALSLTPRAKVLQLRRGPLAYERGYGFLREKIPVLSGLAAVIVASLVFSTWAELRSLGQERHVLEEALAALSKEVLGVETRDAERAMELVSRGPGAADEDPLPYVDAFDVMVQLANALPEDMDHDVEELDVQRGKVIIHGIVPTIPDAQEVAAGLRKYRCFQDVKIVRTNQVVGDNRQKYLLEAELKCPVEKKSTDSNGASGDREGAKP